MQPPRYIPVSRPFLDEHETRFAADAVAKGDISGFFGEYITRFEREFSQFCGSTFGVAASNGTTALHLAVAALKLGPGDEVLVSTLTNMATIFALLYAGATPVPIDIEPDTYNLDPEQLQKRLTSKTKAILVVHLYGHPVDMDPVCTLARNHGLYVIEDCAESHGAEYRGKRTGSIGTIGCFSFYANKIITTGEGGMCTTDDPRLAEEMRSLRSLAFGSDNKFMHRAVGYNYRLTNVQAAIGCAQMAKIEEILRRKRRIAHWYNESLRSIDALQLPVEKSYAKSVYWMYHIALRDVSQEKRNSVMRRLLERGIETRPGFIPCNMKEIFLEMGFTALDDCPRANKAAVESFYLPSGPELDEDTVGFIARELRDVLREESLG